MDVRGKRVSHWRETRTGFKALLEGIHDDGSGEWVLSHEINGCDQIMACFKRVSCDWLPTVIVERRAFGWPAVCLLETLIQQHTESRWQWKIQLLKVGLKICFGHLPSNWEEVKLGTTKRTSVIRYSAFTVWICLQLSVNIYVVIMHRCDFLQFNIRWCWTGINMSDSFQGFVM